MTEMYKIEVVGPIPASNGKWAVQVTVEGSATKAMVFDSVIEAKGFMDELSRDLLSRGAAG